MDSVTTKEHKLLIPLLNHLQIIIKIFSSKNKALRLYQFLNTNITNHSNVFKMTKTITFNELRKIKIRSQVGVWPRSLKNLAWKRIGKKLFWW